MTDILQSMKFTNKKVINEIKEKSDEKVSKMTNLIKDNDSTNSKSDKEKDYFPQNNLQEINDIKKSKNNSFHHESFNKNTDKIEKTSNVSCSSFKSDNMQCIKNTNSSKQKNKLEEINNKNIWISFISKNKNIVQIASYLEYNEILNLKNSCKFFHRNLNKANILKLIGLGVVSTNTRQRLWLNNINLSELEKLVKKEIDYHKNNEMNKKHNSVNFNLNFKENELKQEETENSINEVNFNLQSRERKKLYKDILEVSTPLKNETQGEDKKGRPMKTKFAKTVEEISRDLGRTFHEGRFNSTEAITSLENILVSISFIRPEVGYCQGMNFVAGALLELLNDEEIAFWVFLYMLDKYELNQLYYENMPDYNIRIFQLEFFIKKYLKSLFSHFKKHQINSELIFSKWILTVFSSYLPFTTLSKVYDVFLIEGWKAIISFSLVFLKELEKRFLNMDLQKISKYMRDNARKIHLNLNCILFEYSKIKITNEELFELREEYFREQVVKKIQNQEAEWDGDQIEALEMYKKNILEIQVSHKSKISKFKQKYEQYNLLYKASKEAFKKVRQNVIESKMKLEELIETKTAFSNILGILNTPQTTQQPTKSEKEKEKNIKKEKTKIIKKSKETNKEIEILNKKMLETVRVFHILFKLYKIFILVQNTR